ncbi:MAG TPA: VOC family protein [Candidatus Limnocylindrales bacterium]|nr:VOC family protein [Candidatus Limnocylindrales bacterium]
MIKGLHHSAYRCRDSEETRKFYEEFLGLKLVGTLAIKEPSSTPRNNVLHTFFQMADGSCLAFFEALDMPFEFKPQLDFDLHIALEVDEPTLLSMFAKGRERGVETRGITDHGMVHSIYFRDPNGYVIELTAKMPGHDEGMNPATNGARAILDRWQATKQTETPA